MNPKSLLPAVVTLSGLLNIATPAFAQTWTQTSAPTTNWTSVASSADGAKLVAAVSDGLIYTSINSGVTWNPSGAPRTNWSCVASSATGIKLAAATLGSYPDYAGSIYVSSDSGVTWAPSGAPLLDWPRVVASADGSRLAAIGNGSLYTSLNSGATWTSNAVQMLFPSALTSSANGAHLLLLTGYSRILLSHDYGATWTPNDSLYPIYPFTSVAISTDGRKLVLAIRNGFYGNDPGSLFTSTNSGVTWAATSASSEFWNGVASSADGTRFVAAANGGPIYTSTDAGTTWVSNTAPLTSWSWVASSADGCKLVAVANGGGIWTTQSTPAPLLSISASDSKLLLSWIVPSMNFALQQNSDLTTTNWTDITNAPALNLSNLQNEVIVPLPTGRRFYRLKH